MKSHKFRNSSKPSCRNPSFLAWISKGVLAFGSWCWWLAQYSVQGNSVMLQPPEILTKKLVRIQIFQIFHWTVYIRNSQIPCKAIFSQQTRKQPVVRKRGEKFAGDQEKISVLRCKGPFARTRSKTCSKPIRSPFKTCWRPVPTPFKTCGWDGTWLIFIILSSVSRAWQKNRYDV